MVAELTEATSTKQLTPELHYKLAELTDQMQGTLAEMSSQFDAALVTHENAADLRAKGGPAIAKAKDSIDTFAPQHPRARARHPGRSGDARRTEAELGRRARSHRHASRRAAAGADELPRQAREPDGERHLHPRGRHRAGRAARDRPRLRASRASRRGRCAKPFECSTAWPPGKLDNEIDTSRKRRDRRGARKTRAPCRRSCVCSSRASAKAHRPTRA